VSHSKFHALFLCGGKTLSTDRTSALEQKSGLSAPHVCDFVCLLNGYYTVRNVPPRIWVVGEFSVGAIYYHKRREEFT